jgi:leucyl aminopeptidase
MDIQIKVNEPHLVEADLLALGIADLAEHRLVAALDERLDQGLRAFAEAESFTGKRGQRVLLTPMGKIKARRLVLVGQQGGLPTTRAAWQSFGAEIAEIANQQQAASLALIYEGDSETLDQAILGIALGARLASYRFLNYKTTDAKPAPLQKLKIILSKKLSKAQEKSVQAALDEAHILTEAICAARDLVNEPPSSLHPTSFAERAQAMAKRHKLGCEIFDDAGLKKLGMNLFLAVGSGSDQPSCMIHLTYKPAKKPKKGSPVFALVGKGVTFDSGGLCLKPAASMKGMHADMAGAAAVFGAMQAIAQLGCPFEVHGYIGAVENMTGGSAFRLNDVVTAYNKKTVEILNTDAEGRLVLADVLSYACDQGATEIIDLATLTGACMVALGPYTAGLMSNEDAFAREIQEAANQAGESVWTLPLLDDLREALKSPVADLANVGDRWGGAISAALFLREFVKEGVRWAHLDIAGPSYLERDKGLMRRGGTGFGVATLLAHLQERARS